MTSSILKLPRLMSIWHLGEWGLLTLMLELWQNDIFLILMWKNFTICRIMQLIFRVFLWLISMLSSIANYMKIVYRIINSHKLFYFLSSKVWCYIFVFICSVQTVHCTLHNTSYEKTISLVQSFWRDYHLSLAAGASSCFV